MDLSGEAEPESVCPIAHLFLFLISIITHSMKSVRKSMERFRYWVKTLFVDAASTLLQIRIQFSPTVIFQSVIRSVWCDSFCLLFCLQMSQTAFLKGGLKSQNTATEKIMGWGGLQKQK